MSQHEILQPQGLQVPDMLHRAVSRRGFLAGAVSLGVLGAVEATVGCGSDNPSGVTPESTGEATVEGTVIQNSEPVTITPKPEITATPTVPSVEGFPGLPLPDRQENNKYIQPYAKANATTPENVNLGFKSFKDADGKEFVIGLDSSNNIPLLMADKKENGGWNSWREATLGALGKKRNVLMGAGWGGNGTSADFAKIEANLIQEFGLMGIYVGMADTQPQEGTFNLSFSGKLIDKAFVYDMPVFVEPLVFYAGSPNWMKILPKDRLVEAMNGQIRAVMGEVKKRKTVGRPIYKVANEAYDGNNFLMRTIGPEYVDIAFQTARDTDPSAILLYNDYDNHTKTHAVYGNQYKRTKDIADRLHAKGLIDGVGIEMYIDGANPPNMQDIVDTLPTYPVPPYITEFIVNMKNVPANTPGRSTKQAQLYEDATRAAITGGAKMFVDFQLGDKFTYWEDPKNPLSSPIADPSPYYDDLTPKPALYTQRRALLPSA